MSGVADRVDSSRIFRNDSAVNLSFADLTYKVDDHGGQSSKTIVNAVSGEFRAGELTAIIGPSGSGKTTLLNLLTGYRTIRTSGQINVNGKSQNMMTFRKLSRYVLQEDHISPNLTVMETMMFAANFKLDSLYRHGQRQAVIEETLELFHLHKQANTMISVLSGGQRKRLCIALEILNNPAVLILDEPTTGLDEYSAAQCLKVLQQLAQKGHTVICTIHTPSARLIQMFDNLFVLAEGQCIYQGAVMHIVPYLKKFNLNCPVTYNPVDFIIETANYAYGCFHDDMVREINNGKVIKWLPETEIKRQLHLKEYVDNVMDVNLCENKNSWWSEYKWLLTRFLLQMWRDKTNLKLRIIVHVTMALLIGGTFMGIGSNAKYALFNLTLSLAVVVYFVFLFMTPMMASVPQELNYLRREHFNQWYCLSSYFVALLTSQLPMLLTMTAIGSSIIYFGTDQPFELFRYFLFFGITLTTACMATCYGLFIGSRFGIVNALFMGTNIMAVLLNIAYYPNGRTHFSMFEMVFVYSTCLRHCAEGILITLLGYNRPDFICPPSEMFCEMSKPAFLVKLSGGLTMNYTRSALALVGFSVLFAVLAFVTVKCRLNSYEFFAKNRLYCYMKNLCLKYLYFLKVA